MSWSAALSSRWWVSRRSRRRRGRSRTWCVPRRSSPTADVPAVVDATTLLRPCIQLRLADGRRQVQGPLTRLRPDAQYPPPVTPAPLRRGCAAVRQIFAAKDPANRRPTGARFGGRGRFGPVPDPDDGFSLSEGDLNVLESPGRERPFGPSTAL